MGFDQEGRGGEGGEREANRVKDAKTPCKAKRSVVVGNVCVWGGRGITMRNVCLNPSLSLERFVKPCLSVALV